MVLALESSSLFCLVKFSSLICTSSLNLALSSSSWWSSRWILSSDEVRADLSFSISALLLVRLSSRCKHSVQSTRCQKRHAEYPSLFLSFSSPPSIDIYIIIYIPLIHKMNMHIILRVYVCRYTCDSGRCSKRSFHGQLKCQPY